MEFYSNSLVTSLSRVLSDHNLLILSTNSYENTSYKLIKFEKIWLSQYGFKELFSDWWHNYAIIHDFGNQWRLKLQFMRKKLGGWNRNFNAEQQKLKNKYLDEISQYEKLQYSKNLKDCEINIFKLCHIELGKILDGEETY